MSLSCPIGSNMAAIAKQVHATALQAEADIASAEQQMRAAVNLPTVVLTSNANLTGLNANVDNEIAGASWQTTFDNTAGGQGAGSGAFGPQLFGNFTSFLGEGLYEVGWCCTLVASGVVNDNSLRLLLLDQRRPDPTSATGEAIIQRSGLTMFESNTGVGVEVAFSAHFRARPNDRFSFTVFHGNTSSTLTMNSGAIIWASKESESSLTRVL
jgi:hypothetical protein